MRLATSLPGMLLLMSVSLAFAQEPRCDPCTDGPEMIRNPVRLESSTARPSPSEVAAIIRQLGGELRDITHDCGAPRIESYRQISFSVRACSWRGRYPALLFEPVDPDDGTLVVLASNGNSLEALFEDAAPPSLVEILSGLLKEDFDKMYLELSSPAEG